MSGDVRAVPFRTYEITSARRARILNDLRTSMHVQPLTLTTGRDDLDRVQLTGSANGQRRSDAIALSARTEWFSDGIQYHRYINVRSFTCGSDSSCGTARQEIENNPDSGRMMMIPESASGTSYEISAAYTFDCNGDGRTDVMFVLSNGRALVFEQQP